MPKTRTVQTTVMTTELVTLESDSLDFKTLVSVFARLQSGWRLKRADITFEREEVQFPALGSPAPKRRRRR